MSKAKLIHVIRPRPEWATGQAITVCGNKSFDGDMTDAQMKAHIKSECRGSLHVAYGTCCVTCLNNRADRYWQYQDVDASVPILADYLQRQASMSKHNQKAVIEAEVLAIAELLELHKEQFEQIVKRRMLLSGGYTSLKPIKGYSA